MNIAVIAEIAGFITKYGIPAFKELLKVLRKPDPTDADWQAVWDRAEKPFDDRGPITPSP